MKKVALTFFALYLTSCASDLKKQCDATNWFAYGESVAMRGDRLTGDTFISSCAKEEAEVDHSALDRGFKKGMGKYCSEEQSYHTGKAGDPFAEDMCDNGKLKLLKAQHQKGISEYCNRDNGYRAGGSGKKYRNVCPQNLEREFIPEYNRGRRQYLNVLVEEKQKKIQNLKGEIYSLKNDQVRLQSQVLQLRGTKKLVTEQVVDPITHRMRSETKWVSDEQAVQKANSLESEAGNLNYQIRNKEKEIANLQKEITEANLEKAGL